MKKEFKIREETVFIGTVEEIKSYMEEKYYIQERNSDPISTCDFWLPNESSFNRQIDAIKKNNGNGMIFWMHYLGRNIETEGMSEINYELKKINIRLLKNKNEKEDNETNCLLEEIKASFLGQNILTHIEINQ